jgi:hypothetical protein
MKKDGDPRPAIAEKMRADFEREKKEWRRLEREAFFVMTMFYAVSFMLASSAVGIAAILWWKS